MKIPFLGPTYNGRSRSIDTSRCINFFPELNTDGSLSLIGTPGVNSVAYLGNPSIRGIYTFNNMLYCICGNMLYSLDVNYNVSYIGQISTNFGSVMFADNGVSKNGVGGNQLAIVDGLHLYVYNIFTNVLSTVYGSTFPSKPFTVSYMDGYFITSNNTMRFDVSNAYDGTTFTGLAYASAIGVSDTIQTTLNSHQVLFVVKQYSTELFYNTGTATTVGCPFARYPNAVMDYGTLSRNTVVRGDGSIFMLATQRTNNDTAPFIGVVEMTQGGAAVISPPAINYKISKLSTPTDSFAYCYADEGHIFYVLTFNTDNITLVYDSHSKMWHERSTYTNINESTFNNGVVSFNQTLQTSCNRHLSNCYSNFNNKHIVGDYRVGNIYEMSSTNYDDAGEPIVSIRIAEPIYEPDEMGNVFISKLILDGERGTNDLAYLSWSNDGGYTWSNEYPCTTGATGSYNNRMIWRRLGYSRNKVFKLRLAGSSRKIITNSFSELSA